MNATQGTFLKLGKHLPSQASGILTFMHPWSFTTFLGELSLPADPQTPAGKGEKH